MGHSIAQFFRPRQMQPRQTVKLSKAVVRVTLAAFILLVSLLMALKATVFKVQLQIADMDRHYYQDHSLTWRSTRQKMTSA
jgi:cell division protein FtsL